MEIETNENQIKPVLQQQEAMEKKLTAQDCVKYYFPEMSDSEALEFWVDQIRKDKAAISAHGLGRLYKIYKLHVKPIDKYSYGREAADIAVAENLGRDKNPMQIAKVGKIYNFIGTKLKAVRDIKNKDHRFYFADLLKDICYKQADELTCIRDEKTRSFLRNSINCKINNFKRFYKH